MLSLPAALSILSAISFLCFGTGYLLLPQLKREFERYGLAKYRTLVGVLQLAGAIGLLVGTSHPLLGGLAAGGLSLMMLIAMIVRLKVGDTLTQSLPAATYLLVNLYLCFVLLGR